MLQLTEAFVRLLLPFLTVSAALLAAVFVYLLAQRAAIALAARRTADIEAQYTRTVGGLLAPTGGRDAVLVLRAAPAAHRRILASMLLAPLRVARGDVVGAIRHGAAEAGIEQLWLADLKSRRWWVRAEAARALGLVQSTHAFEAIAALLSDDHEEVRAAAVEGLGLLGDPRAVSALLSALSDASRYQRARVVDALGRLGPETVREIVEYGAAHPGEAETVAEVLGLIGGAGAIDDLLNWTGSPDLAVRTAAIRALGTIGLDERAYYYALRALGDDAAEVRGLAARALGRAGRVDAAPYIARLLDDDWIAAAHGAAALRRLGAPGERALSARAQDPGIAGDLARQMLWERTSVRSS